MDQTVGKAPAASTLPKMNSISQAMDGVVNSNQPVTVRARFVIPAAHCRRGWEQARGQHANCWATSRTSTSARCVSTADRLSFFVHLCGSRLILVRITNPLYLCITGGGGRARLCARGHGRGGGAPAPRARAGERECFCCAVFCTAGVLNVDALVRARAHAPRTLLLLFVNDHALTRTLTSTVKTPNIAHAHQTT